MTTEADYDGEYRRCVVCGFHVYTDTTTIPTPYKGAPKPTSDLEDFLFCSVEITGDPLDILRTTTLFEFACHVQNSPKPFGLESRWFTRRASKILGIPWRRAFSPDGSSNHRHCRGWRGVRLHRDWNSYQPDEALAGFLRRHVQVTGDEKERLATGLLYKIAQAETQNPKPFGFVRVSFTISVVWILGIPRAKPMRIGGRLVRGFPGMVLKTAAGPKKRTHTVHPQPSFEVA